MMNKVELREYYKKIRVTLSQKRKDEANHTALQELKKQTQDYKQVLSYSSLPHEPAMSAINEHLFLKKKLVLPKVFGKELHLYHVEDLIHLERGKYHNLEPNPNECRQIDPRQITCAIIPALAIDQTGNRLGFGLGYYDRLLAQMPQAHTICPIYLEQVSSTPIPIEKHDIAIHKLLIL